jgi:hypothetical protein
MLLLFPFIWDMKEMGKRINIRAFAVSTVTAGALLALSCANEDPVWISGGGGTETVVGKLSAKDGASVAGALVSMLPFDYDPVARGDSTSVDRYADTVDETGVYNFNDVRQGRYTIQAVHPVNGTRVLISDVTVAFETEVAPDETLDVPGVIKIMTPSSLSALNGYFYVRGTTIATPAGAPSEYMILDSVPPGSIPGLYYGVRGDTAARRIVRDSVEVPCGDTATVANPDWMYAMSIQLNTGASGANLTRTVTHFPVLVRLTRSNFSFLEAKGDGGDIRFTKADDSPLPYEIERWDSAGAGAEIWVNVDTIYACDCYQYITMYWGNPDAANTANSTAVFDTAHGFQGVWHLAEAQDMPVKEATVNHYNGISYNTTIAPPGTGPIGLARNFDGASSYIAMPHTADSKLDFPKFGFYSVSGWVYADMLDSTFGMIMSKGYYNYYMYMKLGDFNNWAFLDFQQGTGWGKVYSPATAKRWTYLTMVRSSNKQYLYVDGVCADSISTIFASDSARSTARDFMIGKSSTPTLSQPFKGMIDEVRIANRAYDPAWIRLCYLNQRALLQGEKDAFVIFNEKRLLH